MEDKVSSTINNAVEEAKSYTGMEFETLNCAFEDIREEGKTGGSC